MLSIIQNEYIIPPTSSMLSQLMQPFSRFFFCESNYIFKKMQHKHRQQQGESEEKPAPPLKLKDHNHNSDNTLQTNTTKKTSPLTFTSISLSKKTY